MAAPDLLLMIAKELDGVATPRAQSPERRLEEELQGVCTPPDSPRTSPGRSRPKSKKQSRKPKSIAVDLQGDGHAFAGSDDTSPNQHDQQQQQQPDTSALEPEPGCESSPQMKLEHALFINEEGKLQVRVYDTLEIRAAFLRYCNSRCRPDEMHRIGMQPPLMSAVQFMTMCKELELVEPAGPLSPMTLGLTFTTRQEKQRDDGLSYIGFMDALMDLSLETGRNVAGKLQEQNKDWQAHFDQLKATAGRGGPGSLKRNESILGQGPGGSIMASRGRPLSASRGSRVSEPGIPGASILAAQGIRGTGRLSDAGVLGPILQGPGGRFTRQMTLRRGGEGDSFRRSAEGSPSTTTRGTLRRSLNGSMAIRNAIPMNPADLPVNPLHAAVLNIGGAAAAYSPTASAPHTPSPPNGRMGAARLPSPEEIDADKRTALPLVSPTGSEGRPGSARPGGVTLRVMAQA